MGKKTKRGEALGAERFARVQYNTVLKSNRFPTYERCPGNVCFEWKGGVLPLPVCEITTPFTAHVQPKRRRCPPRGCAKCEGDTRTFAMVVPYNNITLANPRRPLHYISVYLTSKVIFVSKKKNYYYLNSSNFFLLTKTIYHFYFYFLTKSTSALEILCSTKLGINLFDVNAISSFYCFIHTETRRLSVDHLHNLKTKHLSS